MCYARVVTTKGGFTMGVLASATHLFASSSNSSLGLLVVLYFAVLVLAIASVWKMFEKADEAGWKSIIPFYNTYTMFRIAGRNGWGFLLLLIPIVNIIVAIMVMLDLGKKFGKSAIWSVFLLIIFSLIGYVILGFGEDEYTGPKHD